MPPKKTGRKRSARQSLIGQASHFAVDVTKGFDCVTGQQVAKGTGVVVQPTGTTVRLHYNASTIVNICRKRGNVWLQPPFFRDPMQPSLRRDVIRIVGCDPFAEKRRKAPRRSGKQEEETSDDDDDDDDDDDTVRAQIATITYAGDEVKLRPDAAQAFEQGSHLEKRNVFVCPTCMFAACKRYEQMCQTELGLTVALTDPLDGLQTIELPGLRLMAFPTLALCKSHVRACHSLHDLPTSDEASLRGLVNKFLAALNQRSYQEREYHHRYQTTQRYWFVDCRFNTVRYNNVVRWIHRDEERVEQLSLLTSSSAKVFPEGLSPATVAHSPAAPGALFDDEDAAPEASAVPSARMPIAASASDWSDVVVNQIPFAPAEFQSVCSTLDAGDKRPRDLQVLADENEEVNRKRPVRTRREPRRRKRRREEQDTSSSSTSSSGGTYADCDSEGSAEDERELVRRFEQAARKTKRKAKARGQRRSAPADATGKRNKSKATVRRRAELSSSASTSPDGTSSDLSYDTDADDSSATTSSSSGTTGAEDTPTPSPVRVSHLNAHDVLMRRVDPDELRQQSRRRQLRGGGATEKPEKELTRYERAMTRRLAQTAEAGDDDGPVTERGSMSLGRRGVQWDRPTDLVERRVIDEEMVDRPEGPKKAISASTIASSRQSATPVAVPSRRLLLIDDE